MSIEQHKAKGPFDNLLEQQPGTTVRVRQVGLEVVLVIVGITASVGKVIDPRPSPDDVWFLLCYINIIMLILLTILRLSSVYRETNIFLRIVAAILTITVIKVANKSRAVFRAAIVVTPRLAPLIVNIKK